MKVSRTIRASVLGALVVSAAGCQREPAPALPSAHRASNTMTLPFYEEASFTPRWLEPAAVRRDGLHTVADFSLTNQHGQTVSREDLAGRVYVVNFFFATCPGICRAMNRNMKRIQAAYDGAEDVALLSHSVTPEEDTPAVLANYAREFDCNDGQWHLLTGSKSEIYALGRESYFIEQQAKPDASPDAFIHSENFVLVDGEGHLRGIYNGLNRVEVDLLIHDIARLRAERSAEPPLEEGLALRLR
jgi:protein SCO1/2